MAGTEEDALPAARSAVWFFYSKSFNCCIDIRTFLDDDNGGLVCPPSDFSAPCREFVGNCGDTEEQFRSMSEENGGLPADYECHQVIEES